MKSTLFLAVIGCVVLFFLAVVLMFIELGISVGFSVFVTYALGMILLVVLIRHDQKKSAESRRRQLRHRAAGVESLDIGARSTNAIEAAGKLDDTRMPV